MQKIYVKFKKTNNIVTIVLNRPDKRNALNPRLIKSLTTAFKKAKKLTSIKAIVLKGEGKAFCSGADLKWLSNEKHFSKKEITRLWDLLQTIDSQNVPVIAYTHGFVMGGGLGLISVCDVVVAVENTHFQFSEALLGLVPSVISPFILRKLSLSKARFYLLNAWGFKAPEAKELGLVHFVGTTKKCDIFLNKLLNHIKLLDKDAVKKTKHLLNKFYTQSLEQSRRQAIDTIHKVRQTKSAKARIQKLLKK